MAKQLTEGEQQIKSALGEEMYALYQAVGKGKPQQQPQALADLRSFLVKNPTLFTELEMAHNLALSSAFTGIISSEEHREIFRSEANTLREKLGMGVAAPLEKLLIEQIVICWLRHQLMEMIYSENMKEGSRRQQEAAGSMLSASQRRYLRAIETLARVRKLGPAVFQVNIAQNQVVGNVAQVAGE